MSRKVSITGIFVVSLVFILTITVVPTDILVSAQNTNSSTTNEEPAMQNENMTQNTNTTTTTNTSEYVDTDTGVRSPGTQADLSGTYTGTIDYAEGGMTGEATLTITGNTFTLTSGSTTQTGRLSAVTTRGYTGASMQFGDALPATVVSVRAWHTAPDRLRLVSVPGEKRKFSFSTPNAGGGRSRGRRG